MAADLNKLKPALKIKVLELVEACSVSGVDMRPNTGLRDPFEQGRLWRQSRSIEEIIKRINFLKKQEAHFLAHCIESVGPQNGKNVTNAVPGLSWHQWGEAIDFFWLVEGEAVWSIQKLINGKNGYQELAAQAANIGLDAGGFWKKFKDWPHVQLTHESSPLDRMDYQEIDKAMQDLFS
ncbi:M15 family metallopeptidase [Pseudomonas sp. ACN5]|uniref:M15 family metallopeptidase n=1 Tax=Pseudomonas sp. ACN5 TaxID=1920427 RepID=UPI001557FF86|nr:M15 family metallopeptidase [Pseudomonas sp. ACN5]